MNNNNPSHVTSISQKLEKNEEDSDPPIEEPEPDASSVDIKDEKPHESGKAIVQVEEASTSLANFEKWETSVNMEDDTIFCSYEPSNEPEKLEELDSVWINQDTIISEAHEELLYLMPSTSQGYGMESSVNPLSEKQNRKSDNSVTRPELVTESDTDSSDVEQDWVVPKVSRPYISKWTKQEDEILTKVMLKLTTRKKYRQAAKFLPGRKPKQCRERWANQLSPWINKSAWTIEEDRVMLQAQLKMGNQWSKIKKLLPGRTDNAIKNRFYCSFKRISAQFLKEVPSAVIGNKQVVKQVSEKVLSLLDLPRASFLPCPPTKRAQKSSKTVNYVTQNVNQTTSCRTPRQGFVDASWMIDECDYEEEEEDNEGGLYENYNQPESNTPDSETSGLIHDRQAFEEVDIEIKDEPLSDPEEIEPETPLQQLSYSKVMLGQLTKGCSSNSKEPKLSVKSIPPPGTVITTQSGAKFIIKSINPVNPNNPPILSLTQPECYKTNNSSGLLIKTVKTIQQIKPTIQNDNTSTFMNQGVKTHVPTVGNKPKFELSIRNIKVDQDKVSAISVNSEIKSNSSEALNEHQCGLSVRSLKSLTLSSMQKNNNNPQVQVNSNSIEKEVTTLVEKSDNITNTSDGDTPQILEVKSLATSETCVSKPLQDNLNEGSTSSNECGSGFGISIKPLQSLMSPALETKNENLKEEVLDSNSITAETDSSKEISLSQLSTPHSYGLTVRSLSSLKSPVIKQVTPEKLAEIDKKTTETPTNITVENKSIPTTQSGMSGNLLEALKRTLQSQSYCPSSVTSNNNNQIPLVIPGTSTSNGYILQRVDPSKTPFLQNILQQYTSASNILQLNQVNMPNSNALPSYILTVKTAPQAIPTALPIQGNVQVNSVSLNTETDMCNVNQSKLDATDNLEAEMNSENKLNPTELNNIPILEPPTSNSKGATSKNNEMSDTNEMSDSEETVSNPPIALHDLKPFSQDYAKCIKRLQSSTKTLASYGATNAILLTGKQLRNGSKNVKRIDNTIKTLPVEGSLEHDSEPIPSETVPSEPIPSETVPSETIPSVPIPNILRHKVLVRKVLIPSAQSRPIKILPKPMSEISYIHEPSKPLFPSVPPVLPVPATSQKSRPLILSRTSDNIMKSTFVPSIQTLNINCSQKYPRKVNPIDLITSDKNKIIQEDKKEESSEVGENDNNKKISVDFELSPEEILEIQPEVENLEERDCGVDVLDSKLKLPCRVVLSRQDVEIYLAKVKSNTSSISSKQKIMGKKNEVEEPTGCNSPDSSVSNSGSSLQNYDDLMGDSIEIEDEDIEQIKNLLQNRSDINIDVSESSSENKSENSSDINCNQTRKRKLDTENKIIEVNSNSIENDDSSNSNQSNELLKLQEVAEKRKKMCRDVLNSLKTKNEMEKSLSVASSSSSFALNKTVLENKINNRFERLIMESAKIVNIEPNTFSEDVNKFKPEIESIPTSRRNDFSPLHVCSICKLIYANSIELTKHSKCHLPFHKIELVCDKCGILYIHPESSKLHMSIEHKQDIKITNIMYKCKYCSQDYTDINLFYLHTITNKICNVPNYECYECNYVCYSKKMLNEHLIIDHKHNNSSPFQCKICLEKEFFKMKEDLKTHLLSKHGCIMIYCKKCDKEFSSDYYINCHLKICISRVKFCPLCPERDFNCIINHLQRHLTNTTLYYYCKLCCNFYYSKELFDLHCHKKHQLCGK